MGQQIGTQTIESIPDVRDAGLLRMGWMNSQGLPLSPPVLAQGGIPT